MPFACCSTVSPITWSTYFACSCHCRCAQHKSKLCAPSCSRSVRGFAKQLVVSASTWPAAGLFKISSKPPRFATPRSLSRLFDNALPDQQRRSYLEKQFARSKRRLVNRYEDRQPGPKPDPC